MVILRSVLAMRSGPGTRYPDGERALSVNAGSVWVEKDRRRSRRAHRRNTAGAEALEKDGEDPRNEGLSSPGLSPLLLLLLRLFLLLLGLLLLLLLESEEA